MPLSPPNNQDPPAKLLVRTARVGRNGVNTIRVPGDPFADNSAAWILNDKAPYMTSGNQVKYFVDAPEAFREMAAAVQTANAQGHFIYILNWWLNVDFDITAVPASLAKTNPVSPGFQNLKMLLSAADGQNVVIRAMAWDQQFKNQNDSSVQFINSLANGAAILDGRGNEYLEVPIIRIIPGLGTFLKYHFGSQHQKVLCVYGEQGLMCFCGGVDWNPDRNLDDVSLTKGASLHDLHCRVLGPSALDLVKTFVLRWNDHPEGKRSNRQRNFTPESLLPASAEAPAGAAHFTRIARTFGKDPRYGFAPNGERTAADTLLHAIRNAKKFIYTEDQYFTGNEELLTAFQQAFDNGIKHLTVVLTHWRLSDMPFVVRHRRSYIQKLRSMGGDRVRIFALNPIKGPDENMRVPVSGGGTEVVGPLSPKMPADHRATDPLFASFDQGKIGHTYVHAKFWVIDDEFVSIGSVNNSNRSFTHDSEVLAAMHDASSDELLMYRLARGVRIKVWQEHLSMQTDEGAAQLAYGVAGAVHWLKGNRPEKARIRGYNENEESDGRGDLPVPIFGPLLNDLDGVWNTFVDPA